MAKSEVTTKKPVDEAHVREHAYFLWLGRGAPIDAGPEQDWAEAERQVNKPKVKAAAATKKKAL